MFDIKPKVTLEFFYSVHRKNGVQLFAGKMNDLRHIVHVVNDWHEIGPHFGVITQYLLECNVLSPIQKLYGEAYVKGERWEEFERYVQSNVELELQMNKVFSPEGQMASKFEPPVFGGQINQPLEDLRRKNANALYESYDFDYIVAACDGWEQSLPNFWQRTVYFENPRGGDSIKAQFFVRFRPAMAESDVHGVEYM